MNNRFFINILLVNLLSVIIAVRSSPSDDYYWRDYRGVLPKDAFRAGIDELGRPIYVGQVLFEDKLIPGKIYENDPNIYFDWIVFERKQTTNIKILCTPFPYKFEWLRTTREDVVHITGKILVIVGFQPGMHTYLGRVASDAETNIGKVVCCTSCLGLYLTKDGKGTHYTGELEILIYNPEAEVDVISNGKCPFSVK